MNSPGRGRSNKSNTETADWDAITSNTSINTISESDLQRYGLGVNNMGILEKMVSGGGRILGIIKSTIEYNISTVSSTALRVKTEMTTEGPDSNLATILEDRVSSSELSDVSEDFKSMAVDDDDDDDVKKPQSKKRKRNKCHYTENVTHGF